LFGAEGRAPVPDWNHTRTGYLRWFACLSAIVPITLLLYSRLKVQDRTETLEIGSHAPEFSLAAANRPGTFSLSDLLREGALMLEFLRGTW